MMGDIEDTPIWAVLSPMLEDCSISLRKFSEDSEVYRLPACFLPDHTHSMNFGSYGIRIAGWVLLGDRYQNIMCSLSPDGVFSAYLGGTKVV